MPRDVLAELGLSRIINASGTETAAGASRVPGEIMEAMAAILPAWVDIAELQAAASRVVAEVTGAEAGMVTGCSAAGIAIATAAAMTGSDPGQARRLPDTRGLSRRRVVMMMGHECDFGATVSQMARLAGAEVTFAGTATHCAAFELEAALGEDVAAGLFVASHHTVQSGPLDLRRFAEGCHGRGIPVIVDVAAEYGWARFLRAGADLVVFSAQKAPAGPTAGIIAGSASLIEACRTQERGLGRPMKAGKEAIVGAIAALRRWQALDHAAEAASTAERLDLAARELAGTPGLRTALEPDPTGNPFARLALHLNEAEAGISAAGLGGALAARDPRILLRRLHADRGCLLLDARRIDEDTVRFVCGRIKETIKAARPGDPPPSEPEDKALAALKRWQASL